MVGDHPKGDRFGEGLARLGVGGGVDVLIGFAAQGFEGAEEGLKDVGGVVGGFL